jgi:RHS repeat-associated protein
MRSANTHYYHYGRIGSVTGMTSGTGQTEWAYTYEPFGTPRLASKVDPNAPVNPLCFVGQYEDPPTKLINLRARQYDTTTGRFLGTDPKPAGPTDPYESSYDYAGQDPINGYDLSGTTTCGKFGSFMGTLQWIMIPGICWAMANANDSGRTVAQYQNTGDFVGTTRAGVELRVAAGGNTAAVEDFDKLAKASGASKVVATPDGSGLIVKQAGGASAIYKPSSFGKMSSKGYTGPPTIYANNGKGRKTKTRYG